MVLENGIALAKSAYTNINDDIKTNCIAKLSSLRKGSIGYKTKDISTARIS